mmetsp:Transcript_24013/g.54601  ORF Transcript_24013/g.54601 Transcript_24013/m.54601 type:complete len:80 (-) Transcript_24013:963-1202(-)
MLPRLYTLANLWHTTCMYHTQHHIIASSTSSADISNEIKLSHAAPKARRSTHRPVPPHLPDSQKAIPADQPNGKPAHAP